jgi:hypothetical protein
VSVPVLSSILCTTMDLVDELFLHPPKNLMRPRNYLLPPFVLPPSTYLAATSDHNPWKVGLHGIKCIIQWIFKTIGTVAVVGFDAV